MFKKSLLLLMSLFSLAIARNAVAGNSYLPGNGGLFIIKDTYGCIDGSESTAKLLSKLIESNDMAAITALCQQQKVALIPKGTEVSGTEYELPDNPMETVWLPLDLVKRLGKTAMAVRRDCLSTEKVAEEVFQIASIPRVPVHTPRRKPTYEEEGKLLTANSNREIPIGLDQVNKVGPWTRTAIGRMFHMDKEMLERDAVSADAYVSYGPVPDAHNARDADYSEHTWLVEVSFTFRANPSKRWIAVLHENQYGRTVSCELGEDRPTLKDNEAQPKALAADAEPLSPAPPPAPAPAIRDSDGPSDTAPPSQPAIAASESLILRLNSAIDAHDYATVLSFLHNGRTDYFGHRNASSAFIEKDMQTDARTYRWAKSIPDLSTFRTFTDTEGIVHESIQMETSAQENSGKRHHAFVQMDISYRNEVPPSILSMDLLVLKGRSRLRQ
jgi:hypothetical protein